VKATLQWWRLDMSVMCARVVAAAVVVASRFATQIFRYGTCEHAAVSSEMSDVREVTVVPRGWVAQRISICAAILVFWQPDTP